MSISNHRLVASSSKTTESMPASGGTAAGNVASSCTSHNNNNNNNNNNDKAIEELDRVAGEFYSSECAAHGVKPNHDLMNAFCRLPSLCAVGSSNGSFIVSLQLERNYIGDVGLVCLARVISTCLPRLRAVGLGSNGIANGGLAALCSAINTRCNTPSVTPILVLDIRDNPKVTRAGGQSLLNAVSRIRNKLAFIQVVGTRVTEYFEGRIIRHVQQQYESLSEAEQLEVFTLCSELGLVDDEQHGAGEDDVGVVLVPGSPSSLLPQLVAGGRPTSTADGAEERTTIAPLYQSNAPFDEVWYCDDADVPPVVSAQPESRNSEVDIARPSAPSGLESVLYSATPDFYSVYQDRENAGSALSRKFTITSLPNHQRTVYGFCTPTADEIDLFNLVEMYKPKNIELPTKFIFPGKLEYVPAVHAPDPMLYPMPPILPLPSQRIAPPSSSSTATHSAALSVSSSAAAVTAIASQESEEQKSMFWSFFHSANATTSGAARSQPPLLHSQDGGATPSTQTPRTEPGDHEPGDSAGHHLHDGFVSDGTGCDDQIATLAAETSTSPVATVSDHFDPHTIALKHVSSAVATSRPQVSNRTLTFTSDAPLSCDSKPLWQLLSDPQWVPTKPSRGSQVTEYCAQKKIKYNCVSRERKRNPTSANSREFYLQRVIRPSLTDNLSAGAMNMRGNMLVTSNYDMTCKVWDLETGRRLHTLRGHTGHLSECIWNTPICDKVISASFDKTLKVWDVAKGELLHTLRGHELEVVCVAVSPDGLECASGAMDDLAIIWDLQTGAEKFSLHGHSAEIIAIDFSPVGKLCVTGSMDETARVWNTADGSCLHVLEGHTAEVGQVKFNCFGNIVLTGSIDCTCKLWDVATGKHKTLRGHTHEVVDCDFSPDGWICASASDDGTVRIWDVLTGGCMTLIVGHERGVCRLAFTGTGRELITGSLDTTAKVWNIETGECKQTLRGHKGLVLVNYNPASERILTLSRDNTCRIWKLEPESNSLFHSAAMAICQHPTIYSETISGQVTLPQHVLQHLHRTHRKALRSDDVLVAPTPIPSVRSPHEEDASPTVDE
jgi:dynein assembly factor with WDR repeat domains 1